MRRGRATALVFVAGAVLAAPARTLAAQEVTCPPPGAAEGSPAREACELILQGLEAFGEGEYRLAAHRFQEANDVSPGFEPALTQYWFGRALLGVGKTREAAFALYRALRAEQPNAQPDSLLRSRARLWLGKTYDLLGRRAAALEWYDQVVDSGGTADDREEARRYVPEGIRLEIGLLDEGGGFLAEGTSPDGVHSCRVFSGRGTKPGERGIVFCP